LQLVHHGKKNKPLANEAILWNNDSAALNTFAIFTENVPNFGEHKKEKRQKLLKQLALALIIPHTRQRFEVQQTSQDVKQVIRSCGILPAPSPAPSTTQRHSGLHKR